jgi:hypothetical protein
LNGDTVSKQHSPEEIEDFAMRMAWAGIGEDAKAAFIQMAGHAIVVHDQLVQRAQFEAIINPTVEGA